jgi:Protein of unknown function (DUF2786)
MGVDNRQRRAAKKRARQAARPSQRPPRDAFVPEPTLDDARAVLVEALAMVQDDPGESERLAALLADPAGPLPPSLVRTALERLLGELVHAVVRGGWLPTDLAEIAARRSARDLVPVLAALLAAEAARHPRERVASAWNDDLAVLGEPAPVELRSGLRPALRLGAVLAGLPGLQELLPPPGSGARAAAAGGQGDARLLAKVRALLAKAESSEFPEEAELLSAKAQELISRHALHLLLDGGVDGAGASAPGARRLWISAPYVFQKGLLVSAVAEANRCRAVLSEGLGVCTVIGQEADLAAVDLLVTSLLLQAQSAMTRWGSQADRAGTSRTRSFRQSFLVAYAQRVGERLAVATEQAAEGTGRPGELVPVLRRHAEQVDAAYEAMFPRLVSRPVRIANGQGWAAGRAAADLARLDTGAHLPAGA